MLDERLEPLLLLVGGLPLALRNEQLFGVEHDDDRRGAIIGSVCRRIESASTLVSPP